MSHIKRKLAVIAGKLAITASRLVGNQGTDFPGKLARRIHPSVLEELACRVTRDIIIVTGTNGKTTTTNMIAAIMKQNGSRIVHNKAGANMVSGISTAFIKESSWLAEDSFDYALLETDEANVPLLLKEVNASYLLVTNFFRDQLDRYGELDTTIRFIKDSVKGSNIRLILNADDPLVSDFAEYTGAVCSYYGFDDTIYDSEAGDDSREGRYCLKCGNELLYSRFHYAQLGKYKCPHCENSNPKADYIARNLKLDQGIAMNIDDIDIQSNYQGFYNAYNILAAVALSRTASISGQVIRAAIQSYQPRAGRLEHFSIDDRPVVFVLVKNPTGLNQTTTMLCQDPREKSLFVALNDNAQDGRDISWIWDADIEDVAAPASNIARVVCSGQRSGDIALRVKYSGYEEERIDVETDLEKGISMAVRAQAEVTYVLSTYTALIPCRRILQRMEKHSRKNN